MSIPQDRTTTNDGANLRVLWKGKDPHEARRIIGMLMLYDKDANSVAEADAAIQPAIRQNLARLAVRLSNSVNKGEATEKALFTLPDFKNNLARGQKLPDEMCPTKPTALSLQTVSVRPRIALGHVDRSCPRKGRNGMDVTPRDFQKLARRGCRLPIAKHMPYSGLWRPDTSRAD